MISYTIAAALKSKFISELIVSTDSKEIAKVASDYGAVVPFLRPSKLSGDKVFSVTSLIHALSEAEKFFNKTVEERYSPRIKAENQHKISTSADYTIFF